jgi:hypothetical protein
MWQLRLFITGRIGLPRLFDNKIEEYKHKNINV